MLMELFSLLGKIAIDNTEANNAIDDTSKKAEDSANETESAFAKIGGAAKTVAIGIGTAAVAIGGAFVAAVEGTREYRVSMGQLETAFQTAGHEADVAKSTYNDLNAVLGDSGQATEASQMLAKLADDEKELDEWTNILTGVYSEFGEALPVEGLAEAALHTAEMGTVQGSLADALEWSGVSVDDFNKSLEKCSTEQERQELITAKMNELYAKSGETYKEVNKDVIEAERAQARLTDAMAQVGAIGEPILTAIKNAVADMAVVAVPHIQSFIDKIKDLKQWITDNKDTVDTWVAVIIGAGTSIAAFLLILKWGAIMTAAANAVKVVRTAILAMNAAMLANPIALVVALIAGLVAAFLYLWKNNEGFRKFWIDMWQKVKDASASAVKWISGKFDDLKGALDKAKTKFNEIQKTISDKMESAQKSVKKAIDKIKGFFDFKWSLPKLKMPKFSVSGKFGLDPPSIPKFTLKWNAEGGILNRPTIFGAMGNTFLGGGEAGPEAIAPIDVLQQYVKEAVRQETGEIAGTISEQFAILIDFLQKNMPQNVFLDSRVLVGELAPGINTYLGKVYNNEMRGNTR